MKKEAKILLKKSIESLTLSIELFNRPVNSGRIHGVLIFLDHALEMFLKAAILHRGGKIKDKGTKQTIGFDTCIRRALSDGTLKFLIEEQALTLQTINSLRDAAQHYLLEISEQQLYLHAQAGLTLIRDLSETVFHIDIKKQLPERVLPLSTTPPIDLPTLFDTEVEKVRHLLYPRSRRKIEAYAKLRSLAIVEGAIQGEKVQPGQQDLKKVASLITSGKKWHEIFPGVASIDFTATGQGPSLDLRIAKKGGIPICLVPEGTPGAAVVAVKRVDDLGFYNLGRDQLAEKIGLSGPKTTAIIRSLNLEADPDCFKLFTIGKTTHRRFSQNAIKKCRDVLKVTTIDEIWKSHGIGWKRKTK